MAYKPCIFHGIFGARQYPLPQQKPTGGRGPRPVMTCVWPTLRADGQGLRLGGSGGWMVGQDRYFLQMHMNREYIW